MKARILSKSRFKRPSACAGSYRLRRLGVGLRTAGFSKTASFSPVSISISTSSQKLFTIVCIIGLAHSNMSGSAVAFSMMIAPRSASVLFRTGALLCTKLFIARCFRSCHHSCKRPCDASSAGFTFRCCLALASIHRALVSNHLAASPNQPGATSASSSEAEAARSSASANFSSGQLWAAHLPGVMPNMLPAFQRPVPSPSLAAAVTVGQSTMSSALCCFRHMD
mmetsp:Transcript_39710/g.114225  ORF Transcript_39710/g.114225 Transcript_39710/m.114225 type:complete len:224 (-) Transcript_39710:447-1118(-)